MTGTVLCVLTMFITLTINFFTHGSHQGGPRTRFRTQNTLFIKNRTKADELGAMLRGAVSIGPTSTPVGMFGCPAGVIPHTIKTTHLILLTS